MESFFMDEERVFNARMGSNSSLFSLLGRVISDRVVWRQASSLAITLASMDI
jgi:hypothetical protein